MENENLKKQLKEALQQAGDYFVLHVEDENDLRQIFSEMIEDLGGKVLRAANADEALALIKEKANNICLIVSDIKMPGIDGFKLRENLLLGHSKIPFAIASAHVDREMALQGIERKIAAFLPKPYNINSIVELLSNEALPRIQILKDDLEMRNCFISDSESLIEEAEEILLELESHGQNPEHVNRLYGIMHTIKGASAFFDTKDLHRFVHAYEDILKKIQRVELTFNQAVSTALINGFDVIKVLFNEFRTGNFKQQNFEDLLKTIDISALERSLGPHSGGPALTGNPAKANEVGPAVASKGRADDIKVSVKLLDEFMLLSGEVTVIRNMLNKCVGSIERRFAGDRDVGMLTELLSELHKINSGVQNKMTEIRKVPLKSVMKILPRAVRDVSAALNKKIELKIEGDELRVDTSIAEVLNNSLLHIIKNSIDHGIESSEKRQKTGKPITGSVSINSTVRDDKVFVSISDDGQGLNVDAIKAKCIKNGSHTADQLSKMRQEDIFALIFSSGFSTAQQVTEISGRGVGISMVKDSVEAIGGRIHIESETGKGASFILELPIPKSVMIASCLSVLIGSRRYSIVQDEIVRVFQFAEAECDKYIKCLEKTEFLIFEDELVPIANINEVLKTSSQLVKGSGSRRIVLLKAGQSDRLLAVEVSEIMDVEDMVIKTLHPTLNTDQYYKGVTFLDDGGVGLILSTSGIMEGINVEFSTERSTSQSTKKEDSDIQSKNAFERSVLVVSINESETYAMDQSKIYRIEEFERNQIQGSGGNQVVPYRGSILQFHKLSGLLDKIPRFHSAKANAANEVVDMESKIQVVVIQSGEHFIGIGVDRVVDMCTYEQLNQELQDEEHGIKGYIFIGEKTIPLVNIDQILLQGTEGNHKIEVSDAEKPNSTRSVA